MTPTTEQEEWIIACLRRSEIKSQNAQDQLIQSVFSTIELWMSEKSGEATFRAQHDSLREIWRLIQDPDPPIRQIRGRVGELPVLSRNYLVRRWQAKWPRVMLRTSKCDLSAWANKAPSHRLLSRLLATIPEGGIIVPGRLRGEGKRSAPHFEPVIMGVARGSGMATPTGGRPSGGDEVRLVAYLAVDWTLATGEAPLKGRSSETPFGELVHHVFSWLTASEAEQALRRYWESVDLSKKKEETAKKDPTL